MKKSNRADRNRAYHVISQQQLPLKIRLRDILLTITTWGLALFVCWDFIAQLAYGALQELDTDPLTDFDWTVFINQLKISFVFSGTVIAFIGAWAISNFLLLLRTKALQGHRTEPLSLSREVAAYGCSADDVKVWRKEKIITVQIDNSGRICETFLERDKSQATSSPGTR